MVGRALECGEGAVLLEREREMHRTLWTNVVAKEPEKERVGWVRQRLLTIMKAVISGGGAHLSVARVPFCLSANARCFAPSGPMSLPKSLKKRESVGCVNGCWQ